MHELEACGVKKMDERIDESSFQWFEHIERMENNRVVKWVYVGERLRSRSVLNISDTCSLIFS